MTNEEKLDQIAEIFEAANLMPETSLDEINWDSMAMLSVIALAKQNGKTLNGRQVREMKTVGDIIAAI